MCGITRNGVFWTFGTIFRLDLSSKVNVGLQKCELFTIQAHYDAYRSDFNRK